MTVACGTADVGLGPSVRNGNAGTVLPASGGTGTAGTGAQPASANGNSGTVFSPASIAFALPLITPPASPYALVLDVATATLVLEGG